jgi:hypothetical protein
VRQQGVLPKDKGKELTMGVELGQGGTAAEELLISTKADSQVTDPLASWVADSQPPVGPPAKVARSTAIEVVSEVRVLGVVEDVVSVLSDEVGSPVQPDLRSVVTLGAPIPQAKRTPTIPYARKKRVAGGTATRKSSRCKGVAGAMSVLEKAQRRASEKNLEMVIDNNKAQGLQGTGQTLGQGPPGLISGRR